MNLLRILEILPNENLKFISKTEKRNCFPKRVWDTTKIFVP